MGKLETEARNKRRKTYVQNAVLAAVGVAGVLAVAAVAPNALMLLGGFGRKKYRFNYQTKAVLTRLADKGYIRFITRSGKKHVEITSSGRHAMEREVHLSALHAKKPRRWDKRWRMVMFDIPEKRKTSRDYLRRTMMEAGFVCFQDSVWIYPYDCEDLVALLKMDLQFGNSVRYAIVEKLENDTEMRTKFGL